jgi:sugar phosphate isomerase/epimerase
MTDDLIARVEQQLSAIITAGSDDVTERTIRDHGQRIVVVEDIDALIARVRELEAQAERDAALREAIEAIGEMGFREIISALSAYWSDSDPLTDQVRELRDAALAEREGKGE